MVRINWRERLIAVAIHFSVTFCVAGIAAAVIFLVWFPGAMAEMVGGVQLFLLVGLSDLILGPLLSLVVYSSAKPRKQLFIDYAVIGLVQLAALSYGVLAVAQSRPVFVVHVVDHLEIVSALDIEDEDLKQATSSFSRRPWTGPRLAAILSSRDQAERAKMLGAAFSGKPLHVTPKFFSEYDDGREIILRYSHSIDELSTAPDKLKAEIQNTVSGMSEPNKARWIPVHHRFGSAFAILDPKTAYPVRYFAIDPSTFIKVARE